SIDLNIFLETNCHDLFAEQLNYLCAQINELDIDAYVEQKQEQPNDTNAMKIEMLLILLSLINILISKSIKFNTHMNRTPVIAGHFHMLRADKFIQACVRHKLVYFLEFAAGNVNWLSRYCGDENRQRWAEREDAVGLLVRLSKLCEACI